MNSITISISSCMDCPFHIIKDDPDPTDSFCFDDKAIMCKKAERTVASACRTRDLRSESAIPEWCPMKAREGKK